MNPQVVFCPNLDCPARGQVNAGNISAHSLKEQRYGCDVCETTFAASEGSIFYRLKTDAQVVMIVIAAFVGLVFIARESSHLLAYGVEFSVIIGGILLTLLEVFICCLQAFIFTFLTVLFISMVATHHDHDHEEDHDPYSDEEHMDVDKLADISKLTPMAPPG